MRNIVPKGRIRSQIDSDLPVVSDATIMDDMVVTMDSLTALMAGLTIGRPVVRQTVDIIRPKTKIRIRR